MFYSNNAAFFNFINLYLYVIVSNHLEIVILNEAWILIGGFSRLWRYFINNLKQHLFYKKNLINSVFLFKHAAITIVKNINTHIFFSKLSKKFGKRVCKTWQNHLKYKFLKLSYYFYVLKFLEIHTVYVTKTISSNYLNSDGQDCTSSWPRIFLFKEENDNFVFV